MNLLNSKFFVENIKSFFDIVHEMNNLTNFKISHFFKMSCNIRIEEKLFVNCYPKKSAERPDLSQIFMELNTHYTHRKTKKARNHAKYECIRNHGNGETLRHLVQHRKVGILVAINKI
jgi:hypothetical protein